MILRRLLPLFVLLASTAMAEEDGIQEFLKKVREVHVDHTREGMKSFTCTFFLKESTHEKTMEFRDKVRLNYGWTAPDKVDFNSEPLLNQIKAGLEKMGLWYDITGGPACWCRTCRAGMKKEGVDIEDEDAVSAYGDRKWRHFMTECRKIVLGHFPDAVVYFNGVTNATDPRRLFEFNTQNDLEDLPTTWGGYNRFPLRARFFAREGKPYLAMSGKFHTSWGEFGGFKYPDALEYEAASMIAFGAACNFGDQLHPCGEMDMSTYRNVGAAFRYVKKIEQYGLGGTPCANLGLWWGVAGATSTGEFSAGDNLRGVSQMLLENQVDFEVVEGGDDLSRFDTVILGGAACLDKAGVRQLTGYLARGGKLLVLGESGLDAATRRRFVLDVGARYLGPPKYKEDYLIAGKELGKGLVDSPFLNYAAAIRAKLTKAKPLAAIREPYFDRTYARYCSHMNTPFRTKDAPHPGAWSYGNLVYLPHPLGKIYAENGARVHRDFFLNALHLVYPKRKQAFSVDMPSGARVSLVHQPDRNRYVAHLLYGPPTPRGRAQVIEDLVPLRDVPVRLSVPEPIAKATLPLAGKALKMKRSGRAVAVTVPEVQCHQMVVFEYRR